MRRKNLIGIWIGIAAVVLVAVSFFFLSSGKSAEPPGNSDTGKHRPLLRQKGGVNNAVKAFTRRSAPVRSVTNKVGKVKNIVHASRIGGPADEIFRDEDGKAYPQKDQVLMHRAEEVVENDDLEGARALAAEAATSGNAELRSMAVDALSWFGQDALVELTQFMADANEDVAESAKSGWVGALQEIEDDGVKAGVVETTLKSLRNADTLEDVANELVGIDELAALQVLANILEDGGNPAAISAAKEAYNTITGEDWTGIDAAEGWLQKNYEPDEDGKEE